MSTLEEELGLDIGNDCRDQMVMGGGGGGKGPMIKGDRPSSPMDSNDGESDAKDSDDDDDDDEDEDSADQRQDGQMMAHPSSIEDNQYAATPMQSSSVQDEAVNEAMDQADDGMDVGEAGDNVAGTLMQQNMPVDLNPSALPSAQHLQQPQLGITGQDTMEPPVSRPRKVKKLKKTSSEDSWSDDEGGDDESDDFDRDGQTGSGADRELCVDSSVPAFLPSDAGVGTPLEADVPMAEGMPSASSAPAPRERVTRERKAARPPNPVKKVKKKKKEEWGGGSSGEGDSDDGTGRRTREKGQKVRYRNEDDDDDEGASSGVGVKSRIDKILGVKMMMDEDEGCEVEKFLIKWRERSYLHNSWETEESVLAEAGGIPRMRNFRQKWNQVLRWEVDDRGGEFFDPSFLEAERIFAARENEEQGGVEYLVKWRNLPYAESTWETEQDVEDAMGKAVAVEIIRRFEMFQEIPTADQRVRKARPSVRHDPQAEIPDYVKDLRFKIDHELRAYQREGVNWLAYNWLQRRGNILADEMGLGKTVQAVGFLQWLVQVQGRRGPFIVVAPLSTISHWQRELEGWTDLNGIVFHGNVDSRELIEKYEFYWVDEQKKRVKGVYKFNVLVTTWEHVMQDEKDGGLLASIPWDCAVIDEAHRLKNRESKTFKCLKAFRSIPPCQNKYDEPAHCVLMTGTPLQNNTEELWCLLHFLDPMNYSDIQPFLDRYGQVDQADQILKLREELRPYMLRRHKEDVEKSIPPKEEIIVEVEMSQLQRTTYRSILEKNFEWLTRGAKGAQVPALRNIEMELRKCCNHPYLVDGVEQSIRAHISDQTTYFNQMILNSGKMVLLDKILAKLRAEGHKVLIFSQFVRVLDLLSGYCGGRQYPCERIDGGIKGNLRQASIDRYNDPNSNSFIFLICTKAGGMGINLTSADTVIIFDSDWNPQNDLQAQARCHRIGQKRSVKIYRFITSKTYERVMFERASRKQGLEQAVITGNSSANKEKPNKESKKELENLLRHGAYDVLSEDGERQCLEFNEADIDSILQRRSTTIKNEPSNAEGGEEGVLRKSNFSKASFVPATSGTADIDYDDPNFWEKLMPNASKAQETALLVDDLADLTSRRGRRTVDRLGFVPDEVVDEEGSGNEWGGEKDKKAGRKKDDWKGKDMQAAKRYVMSFGLGRWTDIFASAKLKPPATVADVKNFCVALIRRCQALSPITEDLLELLINACTHKNENNDAPRNLTLDEEMLVTKCNLKEKTAGETLKRLISLAVLRKKFREAEESGRDFQVPAVPGTKPCEKWTHFHDRELLQAINKHGVEGGPEVICNPRGPTQIAQLCRELTQGMSMEQQKTSIEEFRKRAISRGFDLLRRLPLTAAPPPPVHTGFAAKRGGKGARAGLGAPSRPSNTITAMWKGNATGPKGKGDKGDKRSRESMEMQEEFEDEGGGAGGKKPSKKAKKEKTFEKEAFEPIEVCDDPKIELKSPGIKCPESPAYRTDKYIFPIGYISVVTFHGLRWRNEFLFEDQDEAEIIEKDNAPFFRVIRDDGQGRPFASSVSPSDVWRQIAKGVGVDTHTQVTIDGITYFGLGAKKVRHLIKKRFGSADKATPTKPGKASGGSAGNDDAGASKLLVKIKAHKGNS